MPKRNGLPVWWCMHPLCASTMALKQRPRSLKYAARHLVSILNAGSNHGVALDGKHEGGWFVSHQIGVEVQFFFGVVSSRGWESSAHPVGEQPESIGGHILQQALWRLVERGSGSLGGMT